MFPLLLLAITALGYIFGSATGQTRVLDAVGRIAPALVDVTRENLANVVAFRSLSSIFSVLALWWSSKNFFMGLRYALNRSLGIVSQRPYVLDVLWSLVAVPAAGALLVLASLEPIFVSILLHIEGSSGARFASEIISHGTAFALVFGVTLILYNHLPERRLPWRFGLPGAIFCACSWAVIQTVYSIYTAHVNFFHIFGAVSAILALLFWFYLVGLTFLFGAQLCAVCMSPEQIAFTLEHFSEATESSN